MDVLAGIFAAALLVPSATWPCAKEAKLAALVVEVRSADYRGDRAALAALDGRLGEIDDERLAEYRDYWRGFARWRRAQNGFNETPTPTDLVSDLELAVERFRATLTRRPDWVEARLAMVGCWGNLVFLAGDDAGRKKALLADLVPAYKWLVENGQDNPRALWIIGGMQFAAPPPYGGDVVKAAATLRRGVALSWASVAPAPALPAWAPSWGGPENLMNLAYLYAHAATPDRAAALAYAEGAVTAVPEWHYVRDILLPQIEALPVSVAVR
jgi:hypothetical protein